MKLRCCVLLIPAIAAVLTVPRTGRSEPLPDQIIREAMAAWQIPGLAVAVVRGSTTVAMRGYGQRDVERDLPVTPRTLFATGSITKSFTALGLAMLAADGRLEWDTPVATLVPGFRVHRTPLSGAVTLRHMLTHRTGMPRHDALWYLGAFNREELISRLRHLRPAAPLGAVFAYNNVMFAAAGHIAGHLAGRRWETLTRQRILAPLGMDRAKLSLAAFIAAPDRAAAYFPGDEGRVRIEARNTDPIGPAAAVYADITDMARYVRFHLADGAPAGRRLVDAAAVRMMHTPQTTIAEVSSFPEIGVTQYGLGFYVTTYRSRRLVYHPGVIDGYAGVISFMPDEGLGMIVMSNLSGRNPVPRIVTYTVYDRLLGLPPLPWAERFKARDAAIRRERTAVRPIVSAGPPPRPIAAYAGIFDNPAYGRMEIRADGKGLVGMLHHLRFALVHGKDDSWLVPETAWPLRKGLKMTFHFDGGSKAVRLTTPLADGPTYRLQAGDITFTRGPVNASPRRADGNPTTLEHYPAK